MLEMLLEMLSGRAAKSSRGDDAGDASNPSWTIGYSRVRDALVDGGVGFFGNNKPFE